MLYLVANLIKVKIEAEARQFKVKLMRTLNQTRVRQIGSYQALFLSRQLDKFQFVGMKA